MPYPSEDTHTAKKKKSVINAYDQRAGGQGNHMNHFPTLNTEKKPEIAPRAIQTLPPPSSRQQQNGKELGSYLVISNTLVYLIDLSFMGIGKYGVV